MLLHTAAVSKGAKTKSNHPLYQNALVAQKVLHSLSCSTKAPNTTDRISEAECPNPNITYLVHLWHV